MNPNKKFCAVYFTSSKTSAVVPNTWLRKASKTGKKTKCSWPTEGDPIQLTRLNAAASDKWPTFKCAVAASSSKFRVYMYIYYYLV